MKGDIIKVKKLDDVVIGIEDTINNLIWFSSYLYCGELYLSRGCIKATIVPITEKERNNFKYRLLKKGYTYDEETKKLIYEI